MSASSLQLLPASMPAADVAKASDPALSALDSRLQQVLDQQIHSIKTQMDDFVTFSMPDVKSSSDFVGDYTSFLSGSAPLSYGNPFAVDDALLDSPLGLESNISTVSSSPFDFAGSTFGSPAFDLPSLFPVSAADVAHPAPAPATWEMPAAPVLAPASMGTPELVISPQMLTLDALPASPVHPALAAFPPTPTTEEQKPVKPLPKRTTKAKSPSTAAAAKDKFTGVRNTKKPAIDYNAPTLPKQYAIPACTSRKLAPQAITTKLSGVKRTRSIEEHEQPTEEELPPELLDAIVEKRRSNTLAARKSRMRKQAYIAELNEKIESLTDEVDSYKKRCQELEELVNTLRGGC